VKRAATLVLLGLIASACRIDVDLRAVLGPDGSGDLEFNVTTDAEFETLFRLTGQEFEEFLVLRGQEIGLSFDVTEGSDKAYHASAESVPAEGIESLLEGLVPGLATVDIIPEPETLVFSSELNPLPQADLLTPFFSNFDPAELAESVAVTLTVTMPGELDASTADQVAGNELTFEIPFADQPTRIFARGRLVGEGGGSFPWGLAILITVIGGSLAFLFAVRSKAGEVAEISPSPYAPSAYPPEAQPVAPPRREEPAPLDEAMDSEPSSEHQVTGNPEDWGES
jgi:hypothetical protein